MTTPTAHPPRPTPALSAPARFWAHLAVAENGGATLVGLALAGVILMAGVVAVDVGALVSGRAAVQTAADMAALAALTPVDPFALDRRGAAERAQGRGASRAAELAAANGAELVLCECSAAQAVVHVRRRVRLLPAGLPVMLTARARAVLAAPPTTGRPTVPPADLLSQGQSNEVMPIRVCAAQGPENSHLLAAPVVSPKQQVAGSSPARAPTLGSRVALRWRRERAPILQGHLVG